MKRKKVDDKKIQENEENAETPASKPMEIDDKEDENKNEKEAVEEKKDELTSIAQLLNTSHHSTNEIKSTGSLSNASTEPRQITKEAEVIEERSIIENNANMMSPNSVDTSNLVDAVLRLNQIADHYIRSLPASVTPSKESAPSKPPSTIELKTNYLKNLINDVKSAKRGLNKYHDILSVANPPPVEDVVCNGDNHSQVKSSITASIVPSILNDAGMEKLNQLDGDDRTVNTISTHPTIQSTMNPGSIASMTSTLTGTVPSVISSAIVSMNETSAAIQDSRTVASMPSLVAPSISSKSIMNNALFFRHDNVDFGLIRVGTLTKVKLELCNSCDEDIHITISDPGLPFVIIHNSITIKARSYVRLPVRFVPTFEGKYSVQLQAESIDGQYSTTIAMMGTAFQ